MAMFAAHIAVILEIMAIAAGLVALHYAAQLRAKLLKAAGVLLVVFGIGGVICSGYYSVKYLTMGHFEHAYDFQMTMEGNGPHYHCSGSVGD
ncbi:MAG: hypothetical protein K2Q12_03110 [Rickettsiales bacterium]|nr:hypothetical protein [Rickettsiales bacterium]